MNKTEKPVAAPTERLKPRRKGRAVAIAAVGGLVLLALIAYLSIPRIKVSGFEITQTPDTKFTFTVKFAVENRLPFDIRVNGYAFDLAVNGERLAKSESNRPIEIPGWEETHIPISVEGYESELPEWLQMGRRMAPVRRDYNYTFTGWVQLARPFFYKHAFSYNGSFPGFAMPDMVFEGLRITRFDLFNPEAELSIQFVNPNGIAITHDRFEAQVILNGIPMAVIRAEEPQTYPPQSKHVTDFTFQMESVRGGAAAIKVLMQGQTRLRLKGRVWVRMEGFGYFPFDFDKEGPIPVDMGGLQRLGMPVPR